MTDNDPKRFVFHGHAIGAGAHFHRLDQHEGLDINVPTPGGSVLPVTGGLAQATTPKFDYSVEQPVKRNLLSTGQIVTKAHGRMNGSIYQTDIATSVENSSWLDRVHFDLLSLTMLSTHNGTDPVPTILIKDPHIMGVRLGSVTATVEVDAEPFSSQGTQESIAEFWAQASQSYRRDNAARFPVDPRDPTKLQMQRNYYFCSVVRKITLSGPANEMAEMKVEGNTIIWDDPDDQSVGFGKIILGEVLIGLEDRRITLARMQMGCPTGGNGSGGEGSSNGGPGKGP